MAILQMLNPPEEEGFFGGMFDENDQSDNKTTSLRLTYVEKPDTPDIFQTKPDDF